MSARLAVYATALTLFVIALVGMIDSLVDDRNGPAFLFAALGLGICALATLRTSETTVELRRDLASWLERVSPVTGESVDEMSDRAVSRLRAGFTDLVEADE